MGKIKKPKSKPVSRHTSLRKGAMTIGFVTVVVGAVRDLKDKPRDGHKTFCVVALNGVEKASTLQTRQGGSLHIGFEVKMPLCSENSSLLITLFDGHLSTDRHHELGSVIIESDAITGTLHDDRWYDLRLKEKVRGRVFVSSHAQVSETRTLLASFTGDSDALHRTAYGDDADKSAKTPRDADLDASGASESPTVTRRSSLESIVNVPKNSPVAYHASEEERNRGQLLMAMPELLRDANYALSRLVYVYAPLLLLRRDMERLASWQSVPATLTTLCLWIYIFLASQLLRATLITLIAMLVGRFIQCVRSRPRPVFVATSDFESKMALMGASSAIKAELRNGASRSTLIDDARTAILFMHHVATYGDRVRRYENSATVLGWSVALCFAVLLATLLLDVGVWLLSAVRLALFGAGLYALTLRPMYARNAFFREHYSPDILFRLGLARLRRGVRYARWRLLGVGDDPSEAAGANEMYGHLSKHGSNDTLARHRNPVSAAESDEEFAARFPRSRLAEIAVKLADESTGVVVKTRKRKLRKHPNTFVGREAVDWLYAHLHLPSRVRARQVANGIAALGVVKDATKIADDDSLYAWSNERIEAVMHEENLNAAQLQMTTRMEMAKAHAESLRHRELTQRDWALLMTSAEKLSFAPNECILRQGQINHDLFRLVAGEARVEIDAPSDAADESGGTERIVVSTLHPFATFGELSMLGKDGRTTASIVAATNVEVERMRKALVNQLFSVEPELCRRFFLTMAIKLANQLTKVSEKKAPSRSNTPTLTITDTETSTKTSDEKSSKKEKKEKDNDVEDSDDVDPAAQSPLLLKRAQLSMQHGAAARVQLAKRAKHVGHLVKNAASNTANLANTRRTSAVDSDFTSLFHLKDELLVKSFVASYTPTLLRLHGKFFIGQRHCCFHAKLFGRTTAHVIAYSDVVSADISSSTERRIKMVTRDGTHYKFIFESKAAASEALSLVRSFVNSASKETKKGGNASPLLARSRAAATDACDDEDESGGRWLQAARSCVITRDDEALTEEDWQLILGDGKVLKTFHEGERIIEEGKEQNALYQLGSGFCRVLRKPIGDEKGEQFLTTLTAGALFGEIALVRNTVASASIVCGSKTCECYVIEFATLRARFVQQPALAGRFFRHLSCLLQERIKEKERREMVEFASD